MTSSPTRLGHHSTELLTTVRPGRSDGLLVPQTEASRAEGDAVPVQVRPLCLQTRRPIHRQLARPWHAADRQRFVVPLQALVIASPVEFRIGCASIMRGTALLGKVNDRLGVHSVLVDGASLSRSRLPNIPNTPAPNQRRSWNGRIGRELTLLPRRGYWRLRLTTGQSPRRTAN